jgi:hypothetical protein
MSVVRGNPCIVNFAATAAKSLACHLYMVAEEMQDAEHKNRQGA